MLRLVVLVQLPLEHLALFSSLPLELGCGGRQVLRRLEETDAAEAAEEIRCGDAPATVGVPAVLGGVVGVASVAATVATAAEWRWHNNTHGC